jgi:hypothetical protein
MSGNCLGARNKALLPVCAEINKKGITGGSVQSERFCIVQKGDTSKYRKGKDKFVPVLLTKHHAMK